MKLESIPNLEKAAFEQAVYAINITDIKGKVVTVNEAYLKLYGFKKEEEIIGHNQSVIRSVKTPDHIYQEMWNTISQGHMWNGNLVNVNKQGQEVFIHLTITPIFEKGELVGYMGFSLDRSQQVHLEKQLLHANKLMVLGTLGAGIAHELNNPLTSIYLEAEYLKDILPEMEHPEKESLSNAVSSILSGAERMQRVIEHILLYSRRDSSVEKEPVRLNELIEDSFLFLKKQMEKRDIQIESDLKGDIWVLGNRTNLESVVHNLLTNSRDAFREQESALKKPYVISLQTKVEGHWALLVYEDNAGGIAEDHLHKIFEPFFTTKDKEVGTGLGLSLVHKIITEHEGDIRCVSNEGKTQFEIRFPIHAP